MSMLPQNTILGQLEIFEVYEYLDGPRLFATRNNIGTMYLAYWFNEEDDATGWLYLPISEAKLNKLRRKMMTLNAAYQEPETSYYLVYTGIPPRDDSAELVTLKAVDTVFFPPEGYFIEYVDVINKQKDEWSFRAVLNGVKPSAEVFSQFVGRFRELIEDIMNNLADKDHQQGLLQLYPQGTLSGSIVMRFNADSNDDAIKSLKIIDQLIKSDKKEFQRLLIENKINASQLKDFLTSIKRNDLDVEVEPKLASDGDVIKFPIERIDQCLVLQRKVELSQAG